MNKLCRNALASCFTVSLAVGGGIAVSAGANASLEQGVAVAGMAISLDNYYASSQVPEADIMDYIGSIVSATKEEKTIPVVTVSAVTEKEGSVVFGTDLVSEDTSEQEEAFVIVDTVYKDGDCKLLEIPNGFVKFTVNEEFAGFVRVQDISPYMRHAEVVFQMRRAIADYQSVDETVPETSSEALVTPSTEEPISTTTVEETTSTTAEEPTSSTTVEETTSTTAEEPTSTTTVEETTPTTVEEPTSTTTVEETTPTTVEESTSSTTAEETTPTTVEEPTSSTTAEETTPTTAEEPTSATAEETLPFPTEEPTTSTTAEEPTSATAEETLPFSTEEPTTSTTAEETTPLRDAIVSYALSWVGQCNYVYGGADLSVGGSVDCSGFTMQVYSRVAGISLPHHSMSQMSCGTAISYDQLRPGDLVFYTAPGHVAIYIGNGMIVHAGSPETGINITSVLFKTPIGYCTYLP